MSTLEIDHGDREHADLGASSCYRWWNCPGSLNLTRRLNQPKRTTPDAERGTAAHEIAHMCLLSHQDAIEMVDRTINDILVDEKMADDVQHYLDLCRSFMSDDAECFTERKFNLKKLNPPGPMFGTSDFGAVIKRQRKLVIVDYKNGYIPVEAQGNPQLKYYILGVICALPEDTRIEDIEVYIVQPNGRGEKIKPAYYKVADIFIWHLELLQHAKATLAPDAPLKAGSWCKFCPNSGVCKTQAEARMEDAQLEFVGEVRLDYECENCIGMPEHGCYCKAMGAIKPGGPASGTAVAQVEFKPVEVHGLTPAQLGELLLRFDQVTDFMKAVEEAAKAYIASRTEVPYWKLVQGLGHRVWVDQTATANKLTNAYGLSEEQVWEKKLISPAAVEKALRPKLRELGIKGKEANEMLAQALGPLTARPTTAPQLVRDTDPRPALVRGEEFTAEPMPENAKLDFIIP